MLQRWAARPPSRPLSPAYPSHGRLLQEATGGQGLLPMATGLIYALDNCKDMAERNNILRSIAAAAEAAKAEAQVGWAA